MDIQLNGAQNFGNLLSFVTSEIVSSSRPNRLNVKLLKYNY